MSNLEASKFRLRIWQKSCTRDMIPPIPTIINVGSPIQNPIASYHISPGLHQLLLLRVGWRRSWPLCYCNYDPVFFSCTYQDSVFRCPTLQRFQQYLRGPRTPWPPDSHNPHDGICSAGGRCGRARYSHWTKKPRKAQEGAGWYVVVVAFLDPSDL